MSSSLQQQPKAAPANGNAAADVPNGVATHADEQTSQQVLKKSTYKPKYLYEREHSMHGYGHAVYTIVTELVNANLDEMKAKQPNTKPDTETSPTKVAMGNKCLHYVMGVMRMAMERQIEESLKNMILRGNYLTVTPIDVQMSTPKMYPFNVPNMFYPTPEQLSHGARTYIDWRATQAISKINKEKEYEARERKKEREMQKVLRDIQKQQEKKKKSVQAPLNEKPKTQRRGADPAKQSSGGKRARSTSPEPPRAKSSTKAENATIKQASAPKKAKTTTDTKAKPSDTKAKAKAKAPAGKETKKPAPAKGGGSKSSSSSAAENGKRRTSSKQSSKSEKSAATVKTPAPKKKTAAAK